MVATDLVSKACDVHCLQVHPAPPTSISASLAGRWSRRTNWRRELDQNGQRLSEAAGRQWAQGRSRISGLAPGGLSSRSMRGGTIRRKPCPRQPSLAAVIAAQRDEQVIPHALSRRALEVSRSWFYKWPSDGLACGSAGPGVGRFARRRHRCPTWRAGPRARRSRSCRPGGIRRGGSSSARSAQRRTSTPGLIAAQWCWPAAYRELAWDARPAGEMSDDWT
jgi:hypothetical protein